VSADDNGSTNRYRAVFTFDVVVNDESKFREEAHSGSGATGMEIDSDFALGWLLDRFLAQRFQGPEVTYTGETTLVLQPYGPSGAVGPETVPGREAGSQGLIVDTNEQGRSAKRGPRLRLASAVMFVAELERSVTFYRELLGLDVTVHGDDAALLAHPDGYQLYLRRIGHRAAHPTGPIGIQYLIWTAQNEGDLERCERVLKAQSPNVTRSTTDGFTVIEGRGPDDVPVIVTYPGPDQAPRHEILERIYHW
jgi:catechol 2,3-dioxygenase-like lactoylglutathione lyase family enzyme